MVFYLFSVQTHLFLFTGTELLPSSVPTHLYVFLSCIPLIYKSSAISFLNLVVLHYILSITQEADVK